MNRLSKVGGIMQAASCVIEIKPRCMLGPIHRGSGFDPDPNVFGIR